MKKVFISIIGNRNAGKSTIIRSLTGCNGVNFRGLIKNGGKDKSIYVVQSSPQEDTLKKENFEDILRRIKEDKDCLGLVIAIQPREFNPSVRMTMEDVINSVPNDFIKWGFIIDPTYQRLPGNEGNNIEERLAVSNIRLKTIDGRKFAFENATIIQEETKLFRTI